MKQFYRMALMFVTLGLCITSCTKNNGNKNTPTPSKTNNDYLSAGHWKTTGVTAVTLGGQSETFSDGFDQLTMSTALFTTTSNNNPKDILGSVAIDDYPAGARYELIDGSLLNVQLNTSLGGNQPLIVYSIDEIDATHLKLTEKASAVTSLDYTANGATYHCSSITQVMSH